MKSLDQKNQKQPSRNVLRKRCFENMQQIYRRTPMLKRDFNKVALKRVLKKLNLRIKNLQNLAKIISCFRIFTKTYRKTCKVESILKRQPLSIFSVKHFFNKIQFPKDLITFTEKILIENPYWHIYLFFYLFIYLFFCTVTISLWIWRQNMYLAKSRSVFRTQPSIYYGVLSFLKMITAFAFSRGVFCEYQDKFPD